MLNTSSSIVDFLKNRGLKPAVGDQFPFYDTRAKLFETYGLGTADTFRGAAEQNSALLNRLVASEKNVGVSITPENLFDIASQKASASPIPTGNATLGPGLTPLTGSTPPPVTTTPPAVTAPPATTTPTDTSTGVPDYLMSLATKASKAQMTPEELAQAALDKFTASPDYALSQDQATADKAAIQLKAQSDTEKFITNLASRGLIFSGGKSVGVSAIDVQKAADLFGVDRKYAKIIIQGLETAAKDIAKEALKGQTDAIDALDKLGYVVAGDRIVQKPSEVRAQQASDIALAKATEPNLLSPTEASVLGVPYGTTEEEAAKMGITPERYKDAERVVPWSQWAAERGLVGAPLDLATQVAVQEAQNKKTADKDRQLSSLRANIYDYIRQVRAKTTTLTREQLLTQLQGSGGFDLLSAGEISTELYGLTKELEPKTSTSTKAGVGTQLKSAWEMLMGK